MLPVILSHFQTQRFPRNREAPASITLSPDLGLTTIEATLGPEGLLLPDGERLGWDAIDEISGSENGLLRHQRRPAQEDPGLLRHHEPGLQPDAHRGRSDHAGGRVHHAPDQGLRPVPGRPGQGPGDRADSRLVLDTATGLGYTAIEAARTAVQVHTIELDPAAQEIARQNPWSQALFDHPAIVQHLGDSDDLVETFPEGMFDRIIHDPPAVQPGRPALRRASSTENCTGS